MLFINFCQVGVGSDGDGPTEDESDARKRREVLARRPSYRYLCETCQTFKLVKM